LETSISSKPLQTLKETAGTLENPHIRQWKEDGGKVVGYYCSSFPQELITAAGLLPFRMRATGSKGTELSDSCFSTINCSFVRHSFNCVLKGDLDFLDGMVVLNSCDNVRRVFDHWVRRIPTPFVRMMSLPRKAQEAQVEWFREELSGLKSEMEKHFRIEITDDAILKAIEQHNLTRSLQRKLYEFRKLSKPPITGADSLAVTVAGTAMPVTQYNQLLSGLLEDLAGAEGISDHSARVMVMGGELDNPGLLEVIEGQGALVVTDSLCFGSRMFWKDIDLNNADPLTALSRYYVVDRPSCPRVFGMYEARSQFVKEMIRDFKVDGVILERLAFCDFWGFEQFTIQNDFKDWDIPLLMLDREYMLTGVGQLRTRVQAFLETIAGRE